MLALMSVKNRRTKGRLETCLARGTTPEMPSNQVKGPGGTAWPGVQGTGSSSLSSH